jgi:hypothetical protein
LVAVCQDVNARDFGGATALHLIVGSLARSKPKQCAAALTLLASCQADASRPDLATGRLPLHEAAMALSDGAISALLSAKVKEWVCNSGNVVGCIRGGK